MACITFEWGRDRPKTKDGCPRLKETDRKHKEKMDKLLIKIMSGVQQLNGGDMGTQYYIGCMDCGIHRDLDKHMAGAICTPQTREEAIKYGEEVKHNPFRYGLLVSFLLEHAGHKCRFFSEHEREDFTDFKDGLDLILDGVVMYKEDQRYWG
jgi:hypothetical protein